MSAPTRPATAAGRALLNALNILADGLHEVTPDAERMDLTATAGLIALAEAQGAEAQAAPPPLDEQGRRQCPERCLGVEGHEGPHQTSDYKPLDVERLAAAIHSLGSFDGRHMNAYDKARLIVEADARLSRAEP